jgi:hypothetical protein
MNRANNLILNSAATLGSFLGLTAPIAVFAPTAHAGIMDRTSIDITISDDLNWFVPAAYTWSNVGLSNNHSPFNFPGSLLATNQNTWLTHIDTTASDIFFGANMSITSAANARNQVLFQDEIGTRSLSVEIRQNQLLFNNGNGTLTLNDPRIVAGTSYRTVLELLHTDPTHIQVNINLWADGSNIPINFSSLQNVSQLPLVITQVTPLVVAGQFDEPAFGTTRNDIASNIPAPGAGALLVMGATAAFATRRRSR